MLYRQHMDQPRQFRRPTHSIGHHRNVETVKQTRLMYYSITASRVSGWYVTSPQGRSLPLAHFRWSAFVRRLPPWSPALLRCFGGGKQTAACPELIVWTMDVFPAGRVSQTAVTVSDVWIKLTLLVQQPTEYDYFKFCLSRVPVVFFIYTCLLVGALSPVHPPTNRQSTMKTRSSSYSERSGPWRLA